MMTVMMTASAQAGFMDIFSGGIDTSTPAYPLQPALRNFSETDFQNYPWLKEFDNVIVVNKSNEGADKQILRMYANGVLALTSKISSGRERIEYASYKPHSANKNYWSVTNVGYYIVSWTNRKHFSSLWKTWMPFAVFFDGGTATHQAPAGTEKLLGSRASGGCVRMNARDAEYVYNAVRASGKGLVPVMKKTGDVQMNSKGDVVRKVDYKTLVIVQDIIL